MTVAVDQTHSLDITELIERIKRERVNDLQDVDDMHAREPHPVLVALIVIGGLFMCCAFWGMILIIIARFVL